MAKRKRVEDSVVWDCQTCCLQMVGGPRCMEHNPSPEERNTHPERYTREKYAPSRQKP